MFKSYLYQLSKQLKLLNEVVVQFNMVAEKTKILPFPFGGQDEKCCVQVNPGSSLPVAPSQNNFHVRGALDVEKELAST